MWSVTNLGFKSIRYGTPTDFVSLSLFLSLFYTLTFSYGLYSFVLHSHRSSNRSLLFFLIKCIKYVIFNITRIGFTFFFFMIRFNNSEPHIFIIFILIILIIVIDIDQWSIYLYILKFDWDNRVTKLNLLMRPPVYLFKVCSERKDK